MLVAISCVMYLVETSGKRPGYAWYEDPIEPTADFRKEASIQSYDMEGVCGRVTGDVALQLSVNKEKSRALRTASVASLASVNLLKQ